MKNNIFKVLVLGESLSAEGMRRMLSELAWIKVVGTVSSVDEAMASLAAADVDATILVDSEMSSTWRLAPVLARFPDKPVIRTSLSDKCIQIITSHFVEANLDQLLAALSGLSGSGEKPAGQGPVA